MPDQPNTTLPGSYYFSVTRFDSAINSVGVRISWRQGHICPCGANTGSPDPLCLQCGSYGRYWDAQSTPFTGAVSYMIPDDPAGKTSIAAGTYESGTPILSIPHAAGLVWSNATLYDQFVMLDYTARFTINLIQGQFQTLPYTYGVNVPATGAVQVYNSQTHQISADNNYVVTTSNGITTVNLTDQPVGTPFSVEYTANVSYIAYGRGGVPHIRPEVSGLTLPKRFQLMPADIWLRGQKVA